MLSSFVCVTEVKNINQVMKTPGSISVQLQECQPPQFVTKLLSTNGNARHIWEFFMYPHQLLIPRNFLLTSYNLHGKLKLLPLVEMTSWK
jgi:hypothetical protein